MEAEAGLMAADPVFPRLPIGEVGDFHEERPPISRENLYYR